MKKKTKQVQGLKLRLIDLCDPSKTAFQATHSLEVRRGDVIVWSDDGLAQVSLG